MELIVFGAVFVVLILVFAGAYFLLRRRWDPDLRAVRKKLAEISTGLKTSRDTGDIDIRKKERLLSDIPWLNQVLRSIPLLRRIDRLLLQSHVQYPLGVFILISCVLAVTGFFAVGFLTSGYMGSFLIAACLSMMPLFYVSLKKKKRMEKFERQLPDALDLIVRSLRAGHAFIGGLEMVAAEFEDPIGGEFNAVIDEINFGVGVKDALVSLTMRVGCEEFNFFVVAFAIQRETGDLCEILEKITYLIRERFKLRGRVRALVAEGKFSAIILIALPFFIGLAISILNPGYIAILRNDPLGNWLVYTALFLMVLGILIMRKMISIKA